MRTERRHHHNIIGAKTKRGVLQGGGKRHVDLRVAVVP